MKSFIQFLGYKIDSIRLNIPTTPSYIEKDNFKNELRLDISVKKPKFRKSTNVYYGGIDIRLSGNIDENISNPDFHLSLSIVGAFILTGTIKAEQLQNIIKKQIPTLLFPYVRATITSTLSNAGFGSVILPIINMHKVVESIPDFEIEEIDE